MLPDHLLKIPLPHNHTPHTPKNQCPLFLRKKSFHSPTKLTPQQISQKSPSKSTRQPIMTPKIHITHSPQISSQPFHSIKAKFNNSESQKNVQNLNSLSYREKPFFTKSRKESQVSSENLEAQAVTVKIRIKQVGNKNNQTKNNGETNNNQFFPRKSFDTKPMFTPKQTKSKYLHFPCGGPKKLYAKSFHGSPKKNQPKERKSSMMIKKVGKLYEYNFLRKLGCGAFADVHLVQHAKTRMIFALKAINKEKMRKVDGCELIFREIKILLKTKHENIVNLYDVFSDDINIYMVMEYMADGAIYHQWKSVKSYPQQRVAQIVYDICLAIKKLHDNQIIHRDLKLQNIMHAFNIVKVGDFGCAVYSQNVRKSVVGTLNYFSPEQLAHQQYTNKIDVWSIGILTYQLLFGESPYARQIRVQISKKEQQRKLPPLRLPQVQIKSEVKDFLMHALDHNAKSRSTIDSLLTHPFLTNSQHNIIKFTH